MPLTPEESLHIEKWVQDYFIPAIPRYRWVLLKNDRDERLSLRGYPLDPDAESESGAAIRSVTKEVCPLTAMAGTAPITAWSVPSGLTEEEVNIVVCAADQSHEHRAAVLGDWYDHDLRLRLLTLTGAVLEGAYA